MPAPSTAVEIRDVNQRYHDVAATDYDTKWGIGFGARGRAQVVAKLVKALGETPRAPYEHGLEIGAGTGYFSLNLLLAGVVRKATCSDISPGMLAALEGNAQRLGLEVECVRTGAEQLPFTEESFDLVLGHAVLHHLPDLPAAMAEFHRVLRPGGAIAFAGEPSRYGDRLAALPKRGAHAVAPVWRTLMRARRAHWQGNGAPTAQNDHALERWVDVHAFAPAELAWHARQAGFEGVLVSGEELAASLFGWTNRALEATAEPDDVPWLWRQYAFRGYLALQQLDRHVLEGRLPAALFYNLLLSGRRPA
jgi:ubiquinone/menaquinone biosynthesis C-methylase UbiE